MDVMWWRAGRQIVTTLGLRLTKHRVSLAAGGMAFFIALAIAPAAIAFGTLAGLFFDPQSIRASLESIIATTPQLEPLQGIVDPVVGVVETASGRGFTAVAVAGLLISVFAASRVVVSMRQSLDDAFGVVYERSGLLQRLGATLVTFLGIVIALLAMVGLAVLPKVLQAFGWESPIATGAPFFGYLAIVVLAYPAIWALYRFGPHTRARLPFLNLGAGFASVGVLAASVGVGLYVQLSSTISATLAVFGAPLIVLLWLYFVVFAVLVGAELSALRASEVTVRQQR